MLFDDTVFNNIRYSSANATKDQVIAAAKQPTLTALSRSNSAMATTRSSDRWGAVFRGGSGRESHSRGRCCVTPPCCCLMKRQSKSIPKASKRFTRHSKNSCVADFDHGHTSGFHLGIGRSDRRYGSRDDCGPREPLRVIATLQDVTAASIKRNCVKRHKPERGIWHVPCVLVRSTLSSGLV